MDNVLFALYGWFSLALLFVGCVGSIGGAPPRVSSLRMVLVCALHVTLSLGLSTHIAWRRLHWIPVEGESIATSQEESRSYPPSPYRSSGCGWRWTYGGVTYTAEDYIPFNIPDKYCCVSGKRTTVWVDPRDRRRGLWIDAYSLHEACKAFGRTQVQVAKAIGVSQNRVSHMESGDMGATGIDSLRRYIAVLGGSLTLDARLPSGDIKFAEGMRTQAQWCDPTARATPTR